MKVLVTGASGLLGSALVPLLTTGGHSVSTLVRRSVDSSGTELFWNPDENMIDDTRLDGFDAVVHLAGESIAAGRWNDRRKARIRKSREQGTRLLAQTLARLLHPPRVLVTASAIGYYGDRGDEILTEESEPGDGFLAEVAQAWEAATEPAEKKGIRVACLRIGVVLSPAGGALARMLLPFKLGVGGRIGSGRQYWSWVAIDDVIGAMQYAINNDSLSGPVNVTAPNAVTNRDFTRTLGRVLRRPALFPLPAAVARLALGEMADALLLSSTRVEPRKLANSGYAFDFPDLETALRHLLGS